MPSVILTGPLCDLRHAYAYPNRTTSTPPRSHGLMHTLTAPQVRTDAIASVTPTAGASLTPGGLGSVHGGFESVHGKDGGGDGDGTASCPPNMRFFELVRDVMASVRQSLSPAEYVRKQVRCPRMPSHTRMHPHPLTPTPTPSPPPSPSPSPSSSSSSST